MESVNYQWDLAEKDFKSWLDKNLDEGCLSLTDILKSTYLVFRKKQMERLKDICNQALEHFEESEKIRFSNVCEENQIMFRIIPLSESEQKAKIKKRNAEIINGILAGKQKVFNDLYEDEFPSIVRMVQKNSGDVDGAKDIFQDGLIILIEKIYSNKLDLTCSVSTYLNSICKYLWMDQLRENAKNKLLDDYKNELGSDFAIAGYENTPDIFENVNRVIETLGDPCKQLLESFYYQNLSWNVIASSLGYSNAASARNQKYKCLERIRKTINIEV